MKKVNRFFQTHTFGCYCYNDALIIFRMCLCGIGYDKRRNQKNSNRNSQSD